MLVGKMEVTPEDRERARRLIEERRNHKATRVASQSFIDKMTSASADPAAARNERDQDGE
ncbi:MAG: hypothetical protein ABWZ57_20670 [Mesorhizobium sp.]|jgi:hypothetical protein